MTPLAHRITKQIAVPPAKRKFVDQCGMLGRMNDIHCFECSEIIGAMQGVMTKATAGSLDIADSWARIDSVGQSTSFLPAPKTWIEWADEKGRIGFLLEEDADFVLVQIALLQSATGRFGTPDYSFAFGLSARGGETRQYNSTRDLSPAEGQDVADHIGSLVGFLAFINAPHVIGRTEHPAHRGLQRKIADHLGKRSGFRIHPWTEIKLSVSPPAIGEGEDAGERLSGHRALHFCRSHLRLRMGRLEIVRAHWRGDAALGVKQTRYRVTDEGTR